MSQFRKHTKYGFTCYTSSMFPNVRILNDAKFTIQRKRDNIWCTVENQPDRLNSIESAESWLKSNAKSTQVSESDLDDAAAMFEFTKRGDTYRRVISDNPIVYISCKLVDGQIVSEMYKDNVKLSSIPIPKQTSDILRWIRSVERVLTKYNQSVMSNTLLTSNVDRSSVILCAITTRDLSKNLVRVRSSNVWAYAMNVDKSNHSKGDMLAQFKNKDGGPGDIYIYYDVPTDIYRRWVTAPSKGHFFWQYIRNIFKYSKLTGNKRGVLPNAIN